MTVTGATTARVASASYTPPFKYVTYVPPAPSVTGTVTGQIANQPTVAPGTSDADYAWAYLGTHVMSWPSYRYIYLLWMALALIAVLYAVSHHVRLSRGSLGASYARWGMRRATFGGKRGSRARSLPSNNVLVMVLVLTVMSCALCVIGPDYIRPSATVLNFAATRKRADQLNNGPLYTIGKTFWTSGSRFGDMAFALMPLVVLFALKSPPVNVLSLRALTQLFSDKLASLHKGVAWLVWIFTTVHVALWTVKLFQDERNGRAMWFLMFTNYRFIAGCAAYGLMTAMMVLSLKVVRKNRFEFFYVMHVVLTILTIGACAVHHPILWFWMAAAGGLWALERAYRFARFARINGFFGKAYRRGASTVAGRPYRDTTLPHEYGMTDLKPSPDLRMSTEYKQSPDLSAPFNPYSQSIPYSEKTLPAPPPQKPLPRSETDEFGRSDLAYYDEGSLQPLGSYESRYRDYDDVYGGSTQPMSRSGSQGYFQVEETDEPLRLRGGAYDSPMRNSIATLGLDNGAAVPVEPIPIGFAQAQLLPSRTVRLTIRVARPFKWAPGQSCLVYLPELSRFQSHPFTIVNNNSHEIVVMVKARKGLTRKLYELVRQRSLASVGPDRADKRMSLSSMGPGGGVHVAPVFLKTWVDGPFGSAKRVRWHEHSSVLVICGGSGVSFGMAIIDYLCSMMARGQRGSKWNTQRVRFCWVAREYAEIAWIANQLRRNQELVTAAQLQIDIFVTNASKVRNDFALPKPSFAQGASRLRRDSADSLASMASEMSQDPMFDQEEAVDEHLNSNFADVIDLTNYEDEEDVQDPAENQLSDRIQKQGKMRRAKSRKAARAQPRKVSHGPSPYPPGGGKRALSSTYNDLDAEGAYAAAAGGSHYEDSRQAVTGSASGSRLASPSRDSLYAAPRAPGMLSKEDKRLSYRSLADSTYGRYDPYASGSGIAPSPSPSIFFGDDNQSILGGGGGTAYAESVRNLISRNSRTNSMVLLDDPGHGLDASGDVGSLWIDEADYAAMNVVSEMARPGKPKLSQVLEEEIEQAKGSLIVATCGPVTLNTVVRNLVSKHISPARIRAGDPRGHIAIYSEDYES